jgi:hypothetical protein
VYEYTPAGDPVTRFWSPGTFRFEVPLGRAEVLARLRAGVETYGWLRRLNLRRGGMVGQVEDGRVRLWRSGSFLSQPSRGALVFDGSIQDWGSTTILTGRLRMGYPYLANLIYVLLVAILLVTIVLSKTGWFAYLFGALLIVQLLVISVAALRGAHALLDFVDQLLS